MTEQKQDNYIVAKIEEVAALKKTYSPEQVKFVKNLINPDLTDNELFLFMNFAGSIQLNPMNGEIIPVVYSGKGGRKVNTITTRNGKRVIATRTGELDSVLTTPIYIKEVKSPDGAIDVKRVKPWEGGKLWGAESTVVRKGREFNITVPMSEYNTGFNVWASKPETMIKKVAESQALTAAFPEILGGIYDESEVIEDSSTKESATAGKINEALRERKMKKISAINDIQVDSPDIGQEIAADKEEFLREFREEETEDDIAEETEDVPDQEPILPEDEGDMEESVSPLQDRIDRANNYREHRSNELPLREEAVTARD